ncbi:MAG: hypothetical protein Ct9H300mP14_07230 [Gammaproteobacteria bacterium]|nr:MAG: hypothetical protein Ct9H300mP14_07230 [Gammaproteobacteria bacterium]
MATNRKVIITCASTGSIHTPTMSEYLPLTPEQIAEQSMLLQKPAPRFFTYTPVILKMAPNTRSRCLHAIPTTD